MEKENLSTIWPILYFEADWPQQRHNFDFGIQLIKANEDILAIVGNVETMGADSKPRLDFSGNTQWFLSLPSPKPTEHISSSKSGISFEDILQESIVKSFLMCLQLIRQTAAICPLKVKNVELEGESIDLDSFENALDDYFGINTDEPLVLMPESFQLGDLQLLNDLWQAIIKLRKLDYWNTLIYKEEFFAACDKEAGEGAVKMIVDAIMSSPAYLEFSEKEQRKHREQLTASFKEALGKGDNFLSELYKETLEKVFLQKQEEAFSTRTRIGRALNLFYEGIGLPRLHSFLSMCLVLETLYTIGEGEILHKLAVRTAKIVGKAQTLEQRKDIYRRTKKVYAARSDIVHGEKLIDVIDSEVLKDAFTLARRSLQSILLSEELSRLYSSPGTADRLIKVRRKKKKEKKAAKEAIREFFLDLDLRGKIEYPQ